MKSTPISAKLSAFASHIEDACEASREHQRITLLALRRYGSHGPQISGIIRDHFPESTKAALLILCQRITRHSTDAWAARPPRVRDSTLRALQHRIVSEVGTGFYGPQ